MANSWEGAAHSVYHIMSSLYFDLFVILVISNFRFEGRTRVLIALVPGHLPFTLTTPYILSYQRHASKNFDTKCL